MDSSSLRVEVSTLSLGDPEQSGSDLGHESGSTTNSVEIPTGDMALLKDDEDAHMVNNEPTRQNQSSSNSVEKSAQCSPMKQVTNKVQDIPQPLMAVDNTGSDTASAVKDTTPAIETPVKNKGGHSPVRFTSNAVANNSSGANRSSSSNQKHLNNNNNPNVASNNNSNKSRSPENQSKKKATSHDSSEQTSPSKDGRKANKDNTELHSNGGKAATPSSKRKSAGASQNPPVTSAAQTRRSTSNWASDGEEKQHNGTDPRRHSSGSDVAADDKSEGSADSGKGWFLNPSACVAPISYR